MKHSIRFLILLCILNLSLAINGNCASGEEESSKTFPQYKWAYLTNYFQNANELNKARSVALIASEHGLNGIVLAGALDRMSSWKPEAVENLRVFKTYCDSLDIEIIPMIFSVGYGWHTLYFNPNLAAAIPFRDVAFIVRGDVAVPNVTEGNLLNNSGFEEISKNQPIGYEFLERMNHVFYVDSNVLHGGRQSLRFENFQSNAHGHARIVQVLNLKPYAEYEFSCWVKTESFEPVSSLRVIPYYTDMKNTLPSDYFDVLPKSTQDWTLFRFRFKSMDQHSARLYLGTWGGKSGKVWIDDLQLRELTAARDIIRRPGTPVIVKSVKKGVTYVEGIDYEPIAGLKTSTPEGPELIIKLTKDSKIEDGEELLISGYSIARLRKHGGQQISLCMSEEETYQIWQRESAILYSILKMDKAFLSMDEIRAGGTCKACKDSHKSMAEILGDCIDRQMKILRTHDSDMKIFIWSDMLDPNANAHDNYYLVEGTFDQSWNYVPKDLIIVAWVYKSMQDSLRFFTQQGFQTMGAPYYDKKSLDDTREWFEALSKTPNSVGIMYTTWNGDYEFLDDFGDYVNRRR